MDPERQPLLDAVNNTPCFRRFRRLTAHEVLSNREELGWRRARCLFIFVTFAALVMFACIVAWPWYFTHSSREKAPTPQPMSYEEVIEVSHQEGWKRTRFALIFIFWAIMVMFLSIIACILVTAPSCNNGLLHTSPLPPVPPVHMTLASLISQGRAAHDESVQIL